MRMPRSTPSPSVIRRTPANCESMPARSDDLRVAKASDRRALTISCAFASLSERRDVDAHDDAFDGEQVGIGDGPLGDDLAPPHHDDAVGDLEDVVDVVGDEEHGVAGVAHLLDEAQHAMGLLDAEIVGRLVEDDDLGGELHGARNGDRLALAARQRVDRRVGVELLGDADPLEQCRRGAAQFARSRAARRRRETAA